MEKKYSEAFIKQYLYNKLKHVDRYDFTLNFSDISMDLRPYIESNYFEYINVVYDSDVFINEHANMLHRNYVNRYVWVRRDELLSLLKKETESIPYKMNDVKRKFFIENGVRPEYVEKISSSFMEWKASQGLNVNLKEAVNKNLAQNVLNSIAPKVAELNIDDNLGLDYDFHVTLKSSRKRSYYSGRAYNSLCFTKNDLEEKNLPYWTNPSCSSRTKRSDFFNSLKKKGYVVTDLGDMSSNFPNLLNCIKTGIYEDKDFHSIIAQENGISRSIAKMASVRCCFNSKKIDIIYGLLDGVDLSKIENEIKMLQESGRFFIRDGKLHLARNCTVAMAHSWFSSHINDSEFFKYCNDFLTSWDVCSNAYKNKLAPSDLALYSSAIEISIIHEAKENGVIIVNAYDHAYALSEKEQNYPWKERYKFWAEKLLSFFSSDCVVQDNVNWKTTKLLSRNSDNKYAFKAQVRKFLQENNYDVNLAKKQFGWTSAAACYWKKLIKEGRI